MAREAEERAGDAWYTAGIFSLFVLVGCGFIIAAKLDRYSALVVTATPVVVMLVYAVVVKAIRFLRIRDDQAGDNLYYMGFLFTLTSLGVSLYQFSADGAAEEIVRNFGVAIGSTIAGVALRVIFNQMRRDPVEVEHAARLELSEAARKVRRELDKTVVELSHFRRSSHQAISEGFEEVRRGMQEVSGRILGNFEDMTSQARKPFEAASESSSIALTSLAQTITESLETAANHLADENKKLASAATRIISQFEATTDKLAAMQTPDNIIEIKIEPLVSSLSKAVEEFGVLVRSHAEAGSQVVAESRSTAMEIRSNSHAIRELATAISSSLTTIQSSVRTIEVHEERFQPITEAINSASKKQTEDRALIHVIGSRLEALFRLLSQRQPPLTTEPKE